MSSAGIARTPQVRDMHTLHITCGPPRPRHQGQLDHGVMVILGQSIKIMGTFATCIHIIYHSRYFLERICDKRKI